LNQHNMLVTWRDGWRYGWDGGESKLKNEKEWSRKPIE
jgi:hypothetical protein